MTETFQCTEASSATARAPTWSTKERVLAIARDAQLGEEHSLASVWRDLAAWRWFVVDSFCSAQRCFAVFTPRETVPAPSAQDIEYLAENLRGESEKELAFTSNRSVSTIAGRISRALRGMGLPTQASRVPVLVSIAAHAVREDTRILYGRATRLEGGAPRTYVVSAPRPDTQLPATLTAAEVSVLRLFIEGLSHSDIAHQRSTSTRTIANQLAAVFMKLGVSGRRSVLSHLTRTSDFSGHHAQAAGPVMRSAAPTLGLN
jgi:DNA-binding CsgD family transcriptional regulator